MFYLGTTKNDRQLVYMILILSWRRGRRLELGVVVTLEADLDHQVQLVCVLRQPLDGHDVRFNLANHPDRPVEDLSDGEGVGQRQAWKAKKNEVLFGHVRKIFSQSAHIKHNLLKDISAGRSVVWLPLYCWDRVEKKARPKFGPLKTNESLNSLPRVTLSRSWNSFLASKGLSISII